MHQGALQPWSPYALRHLHWCIINTTNKPIRAQLAINKPIRAQPAINKPIRAQLAIDKPIRAQPAINKPIRAQLAINKPIRAQPANYKPIRAQPANWQPRDMLETTWNATVTSSLEHEKQSRKKRGSAAWHRTSLTDIATRSMPTESYQRTACDIYHTVMHIYHK